MKRAWIGALALSFALSLAMAEGVSEIPPPTDTGSIEGTWFYTDPGFSIAIFIWHDAVGTLRMRYQVQVKGGVQYKTDAGGYVKYIDGGDIVEVLFTGSPAGGNRINGLHERTVRSKRLTVKESGDFDLYVAENGKKLVLIYPSYKTVKTDSAGKTSTNTQQDVLRLFRRASEMVVDFSEIPF